MKKLHLNFSIKAIKKSLVLTSIFVLGLCSTNIYGQKNSLSDFRTLSNSDYNVDIGTKGNFETKKYRAGTAVITELMSEYTYPVDVSEDGKLVAIQKMGVSDSSYLWRDGQIVKIVDNIVSIPFENSCYGSYNNTTINGTPAKTAGKYSLVDLEWSFVGYFPGFPTSTQSNYSSFWGASNDGTVAVGLQYTESWTTLAFRWTEEGYVNLGDGLGGNSRASGVSGNGEVAYGWYQAASGWSPIVWRDNVAFKLTPDETGEVMAASNDGKIFAGNNWANAFSWDEKDSIKTFGGANHFPTIVFNSGEIFGFENLIALERKAFYRDTLGNLKTFNDYAKMKGMTNSDAWTFYSVNATNNAGNIFVGVAKNPDGNNVTFMIKFEEENNTVEINNSNVSIYPNPVANYLNISKLEGRSTIVLYDLQGQILFKTLTTEANTKIDLGSFQSGVYVVQVIDENGQYVSKKIQKL